MQHIQPLQRRYFKPLHTQGPLTKYVDPGETFPVVAEKDPDGKAVHSSTLKKVSMSMSSTEAVGAINILIYGTPEELYQRMRTNLAENADLREMVPKVSRALNQ
jgi:hypothetical protein